MLLQGPNIFPYLHNTYYLFLHILFQERFTFEYPIKNLFISFKFQNGKSTPMIIAASQYVDLDKELGQ